MPPVHGEDMKRASAFVLIISFLVLVLLSGCNNSVESMLDDYNGGFNTGYVTVGNSDESEYTLEPDDSGYDQTRLLFDYYTVFDIGTLNLCAPASCKEFKWVVTDPTAEDDTEPVSITYLDESTSSYRATQDFVVYIPTSGLEVGHTYKITLSVKGKNDGTYTDAAQLFIVDFKYNIGG